MAIKKYYANKDNTITSAFKQNLTTRATDANMGLSDILETFSIYGQAASASTELERILIEFPVSEIIADRTSEIIPESGNVSFYLNMYNAPNNQTTPRDLKLVVLPVSSSWQEGTGLDMDQYQDVLDGNAGSSWFTASLGTPWVRPGGDFLGSPAFSQQFSAGNEDMKINITSLVEEWIAGTIDNYGVGVHLTSSQESYFSNSSGIDVGAQLFNPDGATESYYTKKFFGRGSEFFFKRPTIEAIWDSSVKDDRGNFYASSSLLPASENNRTIYLYNAIGGRLRDIPGATTLGVRIYSAETGGDQINTSPITAGKVSTGIYSASFALDTSASVVYDRWFDSGFTNCYHTGTVEIKNHQASGYNPYPNYVTNLTNLRPTYYTHETNRFRFYVREKDWSPTIYTVATAKTDTLVVESGSYQIHRIIDNLVAIPYSTGSDRGTEMSFDVSGNYFDLKMDLLEPGYSYGIKLAYYEETVGSYVEQPYMWKFRVEEV
tara:strand:+ start:978 stop:2450 length:1473 start_codon:yes stop_codon:yes gene_type:complete